VQEQQSSMAGEHLSQVEIPLQFNGKAGEYFGIWIVNVLLTIITLGIYAPWAKVRTKRYFYGNTLLDDSPFDFIANPVVILKGYLIALVCYITFYLTTEFQPQALLPLMLLFFVLMPWVIVRSMAFRLANTTYRNIRFNFKPDYGDAYKVFAGWGLLVPLTFGLIFPYYLYKQNKFVVDKSGFGKSHFELGMKGGAFYPVYIIAMVLMTGLLFIISFLATPMMSAMFPELAGVGGVTADETGLDPEQQKAILLFTFAYMGVVSLFYIAIYAYIQTGVANLLWNNISIGKNQFHSALKTGRMIWIYYTNTLGIILSFGLLIPWARVRLTNYRVSCIRMLSDGDLNDFVAAEQHKGSATGEELGEVFGLDIGL